MILVIITIIIVVRRKRRSRHITNLASAAAAAQVLDNPAYQVETKLADETVQNTLYAAPRAATQENIYEQPIATRNTYDNAASPYENPINAYQNLPTGIDHEYDVPDNEKTRTSSFSLLRRKESKSRYEQLSTIEVPGDDP